jgi:hypothetical protein
VLAQGLRFRAEEVAQELILRHLFLLQVPLIHILLEQLVQQEQREHLERLVVLELLA